MYVAGDPHAKVSAGALSQMMAILEALPEFWTGHKIVVAIPAILLRLADTRWIVPIPHVNLYVTGTLCIECLLEVCEAKLLIRQRLLCLKLTINRKPHHELVGAILCMIKKFWAQHPDKLKLHGTGLQVCLSGSDLSWFLNQKPLWYFREAVRTLADDATEAFSYQLGIARILPGLTKTLHTSKVARIVCAALSVFSTLYEKLTSEDLTPEPAHLR